MLRWIRETNWLPEALLFLTSFAILGGIDIIRNSSVSLIAALFYCSSLFFIRKFAYLVSVLKDLAEQKIALPA